VGANTYIQRLAAIELAIERDTERTPDTSHYHVFLADELKGSSRKLPDAQKLFTRLRDESDWKPPEREELSLSEQLTREREMHQRTAHLEYWATSHKFRGGGRPRRK
jgi:hypothetical protein